MESLTQYASQRHRLNRVVNHAYSHSANPFDVEKLADIACMSKFHFSRSFAAYFRETPMQFLWRIRVEHAARNLLYLPQQSITEIAMDAGFSSPQVFSNIFKKRFQISPRMLKQFGRQRHSQLQQFDGIARWPKAEAVNHDWMELPVRIEQRPEYRIAYLRHLGPYTGKSCKIPETYKLLYKWARGRDLITDNTAGISMCPDHSAFTPQMRCVYDAGIVVSGDFCEDDIVSVQTIPGGTYAVLGAKCEDRHMEQVWEWLTSCWLPASGKTREVLPSYEYYPPAPGRGISAANGVELCIRLKSR